MVKLACLRRVATPRFCFADAMIRLSEWRPKCVLSIPSVSIIAFSNAKVRHKKAEWK